jgi:hypothetical protein
MVTSFQESQKHLILSKDVKEGAPGVNHYSILQSDIGKPISRLRSLYYPYSSDREFFSFPSSLSLKAHIQSYLMSLNRVKREQSELQASEILIGIVS